MTDDLVQRLRDVRGRIGTMCQEGRPPRMQVPASQDDDDLFICNAADEAADTITRLQADNAALQKQVASARNKALDDVLAHVTAVRRGVNAKGAEEFPNGTKIAVTTLDAVADAVTALKDTANG